MKFCPNCGQKLLTNSRFCTYCGYQIDMVTTNRVMLNKAKRSHTVSTENKNLLDSATEQLNGWTGQQSKVPINLQTMFSKVFARHTTAEAEDLFIVGTKKTTPNLYEVTAAPVKPWLFSRVFILLALVVSLLASIFFLLNNEKMYIGLVFMSSLLVPFSLLIMFFEINVFKNISVFALTKIFMIGGVMSILTTMILYQFVDVEKLTLVTAIIVALIEETGKLIVIVYYVNRVNATYIFNGMLIGAAIGAGFTVFETAGYAQDMGLGVLFLRSITAIGTHTLWCAIIGAALVMVKGEKCLDSTIFQDIRFIKFYLLVVVLHALWDMPLPFATPKFILLITAAWVTILVLINAGLREVKVLRRDRETIR